MKRQTVIYGMDIRNQNRKSIRLRKAQSALEYTLAVALFAAAVISMSVYIKRGFQGNYRQSADEIGSAYEPKNTISDTTYQTNSVSTSVSNTTEVAEKYKTVVDYTSQDTTSRSGTEEVGPLE